MMDFTHLRHVERGRNFSACHMRYLPRYAPVPQSPAYSEILLTDHPLSRAAPQLPSAGSYLHSDLRVPSQSAHDMGWREYHCDKHYS